MNPGDIFTYFDMCQQEGFALQRGMNFKSGFKPSIILMCLRKNAPYNDEVLDNGKTIIYEGHDIQKNYAEGLNPKELDQPMYNPSGSLTQNGLFYEAAIKGKKNGLFEIVKVYEKLKDGIWTYNGIFILKDAWIEKVESRSVFKYKLEINEMNQIEEVAEKNEIEHARFIPSSVKNEVWIRDKGQCVKCGSKENLHFDHIIPYSKGGSSLVTENIQLLCAKHNLQKRAKIE